MCLFGLSVSERSDGEGRRTSWRKDNRAKRGWWGWEHGCYNDGDTEEREREGKREGEKLRQRERAWFGLGDLASIVSSAGERSSPGIGAPLSSLS